VIDSIGYLLLVVAAVGLASLLLWAGRGVIWRWRNGQQARDRIRATFWR
jgi:hypothetical protein